MGWASGLRGLGIQWAGSWAGLAAGNRRRLFGTSPWLVTRLQMAKSEKMADDGILSRPARAAVMDAERTDDEMGRALMMR